MTPVEVKPIPKKPEQPPRVLEQDFKQVQEEEKKAQPAEPQEMMTSIKSVDMKKKIKPTKDKSPSKPKAQQMEPKSDESTIQNQV